MSRSFFKLERHVDQESNLVGVSTPTANDTATLVVHNDGSVPLPHESVTNEERRPTQVADRPAQPADQSNNSPTRGDQPISVVRVLEDTQHTAGSIKVMFCNAQSLIPKFGELRGICALNNYDVMGINETWLDFSIKNLAAEIALDGYQTLSIDKPTPSKRGGGSVLFVKTALKPSLKTLYANSSCEVISVVIKLDNSSIELALVYRNSHTLADQDNQLYDTLEEIIMRRHETIIMGDFNLPYIDWGQRTSAAPGNKLMNLVMDHGLSQHVREPTRGNNILDLILSTESRLIDGVQVNDHLANSDHNMLQFAIVQQHTEHSSKVDLPNFNRADFERLRQSVGGMGLTGLFGESGASICCRILTEGIRDACTQFIPRRVLDRNRKNYKPPWWTDGVHRAISTRQRLYREMKANPSPGTVAQHITACRAVKREVTTAKRNKEINVAANSKLNPKEFYRYVNERRICKDPVGPLMGPDGELLNSDEDNANVFNTFFSSVFTIEDMDNLPEMVEYQGEQRLTDIGFTAEGVKAELQKLNIYKSLGPDGAHPRVLKALSEEICVPLAHIFNTSMQSGQVPRDWKIANVTAIFKKGDRQNPGNYRPISLTSVICKTMERLIRDQIVDHLEENNLLSDSQHGFRRKRSCLTNLLDFFNKVIQVYDAAKAVDVIYLDFQKAFDKVPHKRLLMKVKSLGIEGNVLAWLEAWLTTRTQRVCLNQAKSDWTAVTSGVPQGSVLGPILFIIYVNDMDNGILGTISKFADDTKLSHRAKTERDSQKIQDDLNQLVAWSEKWQMKFNVAKCSIMHFGCRNIRSDPAMGGVNLNSVSDQKDLGIIINADLKVDKQVQASFNKANRVLGFIARNFTFKSKEIIIPLYLSLVRPHLEYAVQFWSPHLRKDIVKLERIQHRATKLIPALRGKSYPERLKELGLITLERRRLRGQLIETYKYLYGFNNVDPIGIFDRDENERLRNNGLKLKVKRFNTTVAQHFFPIEIPRVWNRLPNNVVESESVNQFKNRLDKHWLETDHDALFHGA